MSTLTVSHVRAADAQTGSRGEIEHVRSEKHSVNYWALRDLLRGEAHANNYTIAIYVIAGQVDVFPDSGDDVNVQAGDSVLIPAGVVYSMSAETADLVECRVFS